MGRKLIGEYRLGDMIARYIREENGIAGLQLLPADKILPLEESLGEGKIKKNAQIENLVQLHIAGDIYNEAYAGGISMRNGESVRRMFFEKQEAEETDSLFKIRTYLSDERGYQTEHILSYKKDSHYIKISSLFKNMTNEPVTLEMFESFSLGNLTPYEDADSPDSLELVRIRSVWSSEGKTDRRTAEDLLLETAWGPHAVRCERYGQAGSLPVNHWFPFGAVYDKKNQVWWGAEIAHNASWQMEFYRKDDGLGFSGGLADRDLGHWMKIIGPGESFKTPEAIVSTAATDSLDEFSSRLTEYGLDCWKEGLKENPQEKELPLIFNEYCTTWGNPSDENITEILKAIKGRGFSYFVIDCGWYKQEGIPWDRGMGDYEVSPILFPDGLDKTVNKIKDEGYVPGIWFEIENLAEASKAYQNTDHLLKKDGKVLTTYFRRFWDMRDPWVHEYLKERVIGTLRKYAFGYMKMDCNETIGIGCDGAESLGEGLRQDIEAATEFIREIKRELPGIILENCASGGHRLEPLMMSLTTMASFSDAHECPEIPVIAAALHRVIHPVQSQIWAVIRKSDTAERIVYSISAAMLGRLCVSGDVTELSEDQWGILQRGLDFYKKAAAVIRDGKSRIEGPEINSFRYPKGWQAVVRSSGDSALIVLHTFAEDVPEEVEITLEDPEIKKSVREIYESHDHEIEIKDDRMIIRGLKNSWEGMAILIG
ncbi:glycoside hydrolase family 36 protein [Lachnospiraceae bacterium C1.1]|nr:alpha-galactosidase [Lachnospiraceae bacterium C1.1]